MLFNVIKQIVVSLSDLQFATVICAPCKTEITVDMQQQQRWERRVDRPDSAIPEQCPICGAMFDTSVVRNMELIKSAYNAIRTQKTAIIEFRIRQDDGVAKA